MTKPKIGVLGATGYIGSRLCAMARDAGHEVVGFSRQERPGFRKLSPNTPPDFSGIDAVVNLAGESILGLWTAAKKKKILQSRVIGTELAVESILRGSRGPRLLINGSAVGFYGDTGENIATETSAGGKGFLAEVCRAWETATAPALLGGVRVVHLRTGFVTGPGGAMGLVLPVFKIGLGGNLGNGREWMSCIHVDDVAGMILWAIENQDVCGAVNAVNPAPVRNAEFTQAVARAVHRPAILPAPAFVLKALLGELSHVLLDSVRVVPSVAVSRGYKFRFATLQAGLEASV